MGKHSHQDLCDIAVKWLKRSHSANGAGCQIAVSEIQATLGAFEQVDAFGFRCNAGKGMGSWMVEAKTSRSDFLADFKKPHRIDPAKGVGKYRLYICPEEVIQVKDLPPGWGLLWVNKRGHVKPVVHFTMFDNGFQQQEWLDNVEFTERNFDNEQYIMCRLLQRFDDLEEMNQRIKEANRISSRAWAERDRLVEKLEKVRNSHYLDRQLLENLSYKHDFNVDIERKRLEEGYDNQHHQGLVRRARH